MFWSMYGLAKDRFLGMLSFIRLCVQPAEQGEVEQSDMRLRVSRWMSRFLCLTTTCSGPEGGNAKIIIYMDAAGLSAMVGKADQSHSLRTCVRSFELKLDMFGG